MAFLSEGEGIVLFFIGIGLGVLITVALLLKSNDDRW